MSLLQRSVMTRLLLLVILLLAFWVRVTRLDAQSLWYDEGVTAMIGQMSPAELVRWTANDIQPPLYYLIVWIWGRLAGWSEWNLRFVSVWFGLLAVPLMTVLAGRFRRSPSVAITAAVLTALHPLLVYYSQEARMYAMLTALGLSAGYSLIRYSDSGGRRSLAAYVIVATAAIYTHYFGFFLLAALGLAYLLDRRFFAGGPDGWWPRVRGFVLADLLVLLAYAPWFLVMFNRLALDTSYWQGRLKLLEALRNVVASFVAGETVVQAQATLLIGLIALVTLFAVFQLWQYGRAGRRTLMWGLLWLIVPVICVLALASFAPKFNPRYAMVALPGLLLVWSTGIVPKRVDRMDSTTLERSQSISGLQPTMTVVFLFLLLSTFLYANLNWFVDPAFRKDQWRELTTDLRMRVKQDEAIVLVSGHAWPVWDYYAADLPVLRLPDLDVLDVEAVLDFGDTAQPLRRALKPLAERPGVWLVGWQDDVVDPMDIVAAQLEIAGREKGMDSAYWGLELRRFSQLKADWIPDTAPIESQVDATFGEIVTLLGYNALDNGDLLLFWQLQPDATRSAPDLFVTGETLDALGNPVAVLADRRSAGYNFPSFRWTPERVAVSYLSARDWLGDAPQEGIYYLDVQTYDVSGNRAPLPLPDGADRVHLGPIVVVID